MKRFAFLSFALFLPMAWMIAASPEANWPQWRGPHLNGTSTRAKHLPVTWSETENVVWRTKLPSWSAATPIIWEDTVFVTSAEEGFSQASENPDKLFLIAVNRNDGSIRWQKLLGQGNRFYMKQNMASPSPVTDGQHVWIMTGTGVLACFDFAGHEVWQRDIQKEYGSFGLHYGYGSSPLLHEGRLYVQVLHGMTTDDPSYVFAADAKTGKTIWKIERPTDAIRESPDNYGTPILIPLEGKLQLVISGGDYVTGHDLGNGIELWRMGGFNPENSRTYRTIASSLAFDGIIYASSTRGMPFIAFRAGGIGDITKTNLLWQNNLGADVPSPTTDGKRIYVVNDNGIVVAFDPKTGDIEWERRRIEPGIYSASPVIADGKMYATSEEGTTTVLAVGGEFKILAVNKLGSYTLATPAPVDNQIFIRTADYLYCIANK
jgi:outer membrane protein assembly factor BamB